MSSFFSFVILLGIFLSATTCTFLMIGGLVNALFNRTHARAYGPGDVIDNSAVGSYTIHYNSWGGDYSVGSGGDCGGDGGSGDCG